MKKADAEKLNVGDWVVYRQQSRWRKRPSLVGRVLVNGLSLGGAAVVAVQFGEVTKACGISALRKATKDEAISGALNE